jgi:ATP-dependent DNA helicase RecG
LAEALQYVHRPPPEAAVDLLLAREHMMQKRLAFEELMAYLLSLRKTRQKVQTFSAVDCVAGHPQRALFLENLGFRLTSAQERTVDEIEKDLVKPYPMLRLLQGDVGSGKTVVAAMAALRVLANNRQVALMAPSEILAEQHGALFTKWFKPLGISVAFLAGKQSTSVRRETLACIAEGQAQIVIGTHALFQEEVKFAQLALTIVDEQHRFGVQQRLALWEKAGKNNIFPHQLIMSATPIPRTLSMVAYADLDVSILDELPPGRKPVKTILVASERRREEIIARVKQVCMEQRQVYWVCTRIEDSEILQCQAAEAVFQELKIKLPFCQIGLVHSRLSSEEKDTVMQAFKTGQIQLLIATTVIEVGIDVPNASLMIIENSERLGLAQLHQLRGRVGRGAVESFCVLLFQYPLSTLAKKRLQIMRETNNGFLIAEQDLAIRGPGEIYGLRQAGLQQLKIADLVKDQHLLPKVHAAAQHLLEYYPEHAESLMARWLSTNQRYIQA